MSTKRLTQGTGDSAGTDRHLAMRWVTSTGDDGRRHLEMSWFVPQGRSQPAAA